VNTPGGVSGVDLQAAEIVMNWYQVPIEDRSEIWEKVQLLVDAVIKECIEEAERKAAEKKRNK